jgi:hypothetical protein
MDDVPFVFPPTMAPDEAQRILAEAYSSIDEGKLLRRTNKLLRKRNIDPPNDVQYVAAPALAPSREGLGIVLGCDILIYDEFPELDDCVDAFEETLNDLLMPRIFKAVEKWKSRRASAP